MLDSFRYLMDHLSLSRGPKSKRPARCIPVTNDQQIQLRCTFSELFLEQQTELPLYITLYNNNGAGAGGLIHYHWVAKQLSYFAVLTDSIKHLIEAVASCNTSRVF